MAKNKQTKTESKKEVEVKPKGPKVDYTPKKPVPKKGVVAEKPAIVYYGESTFTMIEEGAGCSWNEASRQLCLDAAQEYIESYTQAARPALYNFANRAALIENAKELSKAESDYFGGQITMGSHMKRQRFWKFLTYISHGRIPNDLRLRAGPRNSDHLTGEERASIMMSATALIKERAARHIENGTREDAVFRVTFLVNSDTERTLRRVESSDYPSWEDPIKFEAASQDYNPETMKGYKSMKEWATRP